LNGSFSASGSLAKRREEKRREEKRRERETSLFSWKRRPEEEGEEEEW